MPTFLLNSSVHTLTQHTTEPKIYEKLIYNQLDDYFDDTFTMSMWIP